LGVVVVAAVTHAPMRLLSETALAGLLRQAQDEHHKVAASGSECLLDWPEWYAFFIMERSAVPIDLVAEAVEIPPATASKPTPLAEFDEYGDGDAPVPAAKPVKYHSIMDHGPSWPAEAAMGDLIEHGRE
jgi:hypothetical protein